MGFVEEINGLKHAGEMMKLDGVLDDFPSEGSFLLGVQSTKKDRETNGTSPFVSGMDVLFAFRGDLFPVEARDMCHAPVCRTALQGAGSIWNKSLLERRSHPAGFDLPMGKSGSALSVLKNMGEPQKCD